MAYNDKPFIATIDCSQEVETELKRIKRRDMWKKGIKKR